MATKLYPIGMQTFSEIREEDFLYVDKTEYIYRMTHTSGKYFFLSRPRRFGKSLLVSTMQSYFEGKKELFKGLAVEKLEKEWTEYPVLHFDMSGGKHMEPEQLELYLGYILEDQEKKWGINEPRIGANNRLIDTFVILFSSLKMLTCENLVIPVRKRKRSFASLYFRGLKKLRMILRNTSSCSFS